MKQMADADNAPGLTPFRRARQFRNGLMVALLAERPIRLKNFSALELGRSFVEVEGQWWIVLDGRDTKEGRPDERRVPEALMSHLRRYLTHHRNVLAGMQEPSTALWLSTYGQPMRYDSVAAAIAETTRQTVGMKVRPHLFRTSAGSSAAIHAAQLPHLTSAVLNHRDQKTAHEHYIRVASMSAGQVYLDVINSYLD
jgi:integrase